jgi:hypothetical protein
VPGAADAPVGRSAKAATTEAAKPRPANRMDILLMALTA